MTRRISKQATLAVYLLIVGAGSGCSENGVPPAEGHFVGTYIEFDVEHGDIYNMKLHGIGCDGTNAKGQVCGYYAKNQMHWGPYEVNSGTFKETLADQGQLTLRVSGTFHNTLAGVGGIKMQGRWQVKADGCCSGWGTLAAYLDGTTIPPDTDVTIHIPNLPDLVVLEDFSAPEDMVWPDTNEPDPGITWEQGDCADDYLTTPYGGCAPPDSTSDQLLALSETNRIRSWINLDRINEHPALNQAAQAHCQCFVDHYQEVYAKGMSAHQEDPSYDGCYGAHFWDRMAHFGYTSQGSHEVMAFVASPLGAIHSWAESLFHRLPFVDPNVRETGYGQSIGETAHCDTMDFGSGAQVDDNHDAIYPFNDQVGVGPSWHGNETPQPPKPNNGYPSGPIITITSPKGVDLVVSKYNITDPYGVDIPVVFVDHRALDYLPRTTAIYSHNPLSEDTTYTVFMSGTRNAKPWERTWSFTTGTSGYNWNYSQLP
jgi:hypothetical protein